MYIEFYIDVSYGIHYNYKMYNNSINGYYIKLIFGR